MRELRSIPFYSLIYHRSVKFLKRLMGKTNVEIVLRRLDLLSEDCSAKSNESLIKLNGQNVRLTSPEMLCPSTDVADMMRLFEGTTRTIHRTSRQHCLSVFIHVLTFFPSVFETIALGN